jgi:hypothetical protein
LVIGNWVTGYFLPYYPLPITSHYEKYVSLCPPTRGSDNKDKLRFAQIQRSDKNGFKIQSFGWVVGAV